MRRALRHHARMYLDDLETRSITNRPMVFGDSAVWPGDRPGHVDRPSPSPSAHDVLLIDLDLGVSPVLGGRTGETGTAGDRGLDHPGVDSGADHLDDRLPAFLFADHGPSPVVAEEFHGDRGIGVLGLDEDGAFGVVAKDEIGRRPGDRGLDAFWVTAEVEAVGAVVYVLVSAPENGVVEGRCELADAPTDGVDQLAVDDRSGLSVPLGSGPEPDILIERKLLARQNEGAVDLVRDEMNVEYTILAA